MMRWECTRQEERSLVTFEEFLQAELGALIRFAGAVTGDEHLAQDVLSDALLKITSRWRRVSAMADPGAYIRRVVVTTYLSDRRKAQRRKTEPTDDTARLDRATQDASEAVVQRDEVARLLAHLTPRQRVAIVLRYLLDQTDDQIADTLDCTVATVRSHLSHARATLRLVGSLPADRT
jgi:RNA polymerase sigma-70 factor (sigma-E family)